MVAQHCHSAVDTSFAALGPAKVAFLGVVQGITELLPVSSSAHMRAIPALLGWPDPGAAFSAAMQLAALAAVVTYFGSEILSVTTGSAVATPATRIGCCTSRRIATCSPPSPSACTVPTSLSKARSSTSHH